MPSEIPLLHVDERLIAIDKPAGLLSVPGRGEDKQDCAWSRVRTQFPEALVVHRLDQATSGLLLFARTLEAQRELGSAFERRQVSKRYQALVWGELTEAEGLIDLPLAADWPNRPRQRVCFDGGRPSQTRWRRGTMGDGQTRLLLEPLTGRSHQLRVHLLAIGHPIVGDTLYDPDRHAPRLMLHAQDLVLPGLTLNSPCPF
ncbi:MAG: RNA pseudouridine synthase [Burkholderiales bacterium]|nr:RNA pseudouridine synthase [Burkholderiales bacterium]